MMPNIKQKSAAKIEDAQEHSRDTRRLSEHAYIAILEGLFNRTIPAGAFLSQNDLVKLLGIPVQPLRDALKVLETEGVVVIQARSGIKFLKPDMELARSTYQFRAIIERAAVRHLAETGDSRDVETLLEAHLTLLEKVKQGGLDESAVIDLEDLDRRLHQTIIASLSNPLVENTAQRLKNYVTLIGLNRLKTAPLAMRTLNEHIEILQACKERDADRAEAALSTHFNSALYRMLGM